MLIMYTAYYFSSYAELSFSFHCYEDCGDNDVAEYATMHLEHLVKVPSDWTLQSIDADVPATMI